MYVKAAVVADYADYADWHDLSDYVVHFTKPLDPHEIVRCGYCAPREWGGRPIVWCC